MKKTILMALLAISMAACTQTQPQPQRCELFGVSLGMTHEEVSGILIERFGKGESYGESNSFFYKDIFHDGMKYSYVDFSFENGQLTDVYAICDKEVDFSEIEDYYENINKMWSNIHEMDSILAQRHKIYNNPASRGIEDGSIVTIATKDRVNMVDYIAVRINRTSSGYNKQGDMYGTAYISISLSNIEKEL